MFQRLSHYEQRSIPPANPGAPDPNSQYTRICTASAEVREQLTGLGAEIVSQQDSASGPVGLTCLIHPRIFRQIRYHIRRSAVIGAEACKRVVIRNKHITVHCCMFGWLTLYVLVCQRTSFQGWSKSVRWWRRGRGGGRQAEPSCQPRPRHTQKPPSIICTINNDRCSCSSSNTSFSAQPSPGQGYPSTFVSEMRGR